MDGALHLQWESYFNIDLLPFTSRRNLKPGPHQPFWPTMSKQRSTLSNGQNFNAKLIRHCCRFWQQSRTLLRHCCRCGPGFADRIRDDHASIRKWPSIVFGVRHRVIAKKSLFTGREDKRTSKRIRMTSLTGIDDDDRDRHLVCLYTVVHVMPSENVGEDIMFSGCPSAVFVRSFVRTCNCTVTKTSHERLEQSRWNLQGITTHLPLLMTWLVSGGQKSRSQQAVEMARASHSTSTLGHSSHLLLYYWPAYT